MNVIVDMPKLFQDQDLAFSFYIDGLDDDVLRPLSFSGSEELFGLHHFNMELVSHKSDLNLHDLLDSKCTLTIHHKYQGVRHISGVVAEVSRGDKGHHRTRYSLAFLPVIHRLDHGSDCRIFQQKTVPEIVKEILKEHGITDVKWTLAGDHQPREYCVQYRETHLQFITRIAAEEGIFFYFKHGNKGTHTLNFLDDSQISPKLEEAEILTYNADAGGNVKGPYVSNFSFSERVRSTSWAQRDYTFKNPPYNLEHKHRVQEDNGSAKDYAMYDYPGRYKRDAAGKPFTKHLMESTRVDASNGHGTCDNIYLCPGYKTSLEDHPDRAQNIKYLLLNVSHFGEQPSALEEDSDGGMTQYSASFQAMPTRLPYKPPQKNRPLVDGPQMAHIVGPQGEEIYCDEHGRVKVQFPWDRYAKGDEHCSCWIRVASNWAGTMWGHIAIPRIGQEVIVDFLEGDPDQPIITGRTYHMRNKPPYELPLHKTRMTIRSDSHKANYIGYNELRFEDEAGKEEVFVHAQKDMNIEILNDRSKRVENDQSEVVGQDKSIEVGGDHDEVILGNYSIAIGQNPLSSTLMGKTKVLFSKASQFMEKLKIPDPFNFAKGNMQMFVEKNKSEITGIGSSEIVGVAKSLIVGQSYQQTVGKEMSTIVRGRHDTDVGQVKNIRVGDQLTIKVGENSIFTMSKEGDILIKGKKIKLQADSIETN